MTDLQEDETTNYTGETKANLPGKAITLCIIALMVDVILKQSFLCSTRRHMLLGKGRKS